MIRTATNIQKPHETVTEDGLLYKGIIKWKNLEEKDKILFLIEENFEIPEELYYINDQFERVEMKWEILEESHELFKSNDLECGIIQELPDYKKTIIRYDPY